MASFWEIRNPDGFLSTSMSIEGVQVSIESHNGKHRYLIHQQKDSPVRPGAPHMTQPLSQKKPDPDVFAMDIGERIRQLEEADALKEEALKKARLDRKDEMAAIHEALTGFVTAIGRLTTMRRSYGPVQAYWDVTTGGIIFKWGAALEVLFEATSPGILWRIVGPVPPGNNDTGMMFSDFACRVDYQALELVKKLIWPLL